MQKLIKMKNPKGIKLDRLQHLMQTIDEKKKLEHDEVEILRKEEERKRKEEEERRKKEEEEKRIRKENYCAWHQTVRASYTCSGCNKRFCIKCLGEKQDEQLYCKGCWSTFKYKSLIKKKTDSQQDKSQISQEVQEILQNMGSYGIEELVQNLRILGAHRSPEVVKALIDKLDHAEEIVRSEAVKSLGKIGDPKAVLPLCNLLADSDKNVRKTAVLSLGFLKDARAFSHLEQLYKIEKDPYIKEDIIDAMESLKKVKEETAFVLIKRLETNNWDERTEIMNEIVKLGEEAVMPLIKALSFRNREIIIASLEALATMGDKRAVDPTIPLLKHHEQNIRLSAIDALGRYRDDRAVPYLLELEEEENEQIKLALLNTLSFFPSEDIIDPLINSLFHESENVKKKAADIIKNIEIPQISVAMVNVLIKAREVRGIAFEILEKRGGEVLTELLQALFESNESDVQSDIIEILAIVGEKETLEYLRDFSGKKTIDKEVRNRAKEACKRLSKKLGLGLGDTISKFIRGLNIGYMNFQAKVTEKQRNLLKKKSKKEVIPTCSVCHEKLRKQYPELVSKGEIIWQLKNRHECEKCGKLFCPKCAKQTNMGAGTILISCPDCKKDLGKKDGYKL